LDPEGTIRAAQFLVSIDKDTAQGLLQQFSEEERTKLNSAMQQQQSVDPKTANEVFAAFAEEVEKVLASSGDHEDEAFELASGRLPKELIPPGDDVKLTKVADIPAEELSGFIRGESPQTIAFILTQMEAKNSAEVINELPESIHGDVINRMARLASPCQRLVLVIDEWLEEMLKGGVTPVAAEEPGEAGGNAPPKRKKATDQHKIVAKLLSSVPSAICDASLDHMRKLDEEEAKLVRSLMFLFEDFARLEDRAAQQVLRELDNRTMATALKGASEAVKEKIFGNISKRAAEMMNDELEMLGNRPQAEVEGAQRQIAQIAVRLAGEGTIELPSMDEEGEE